MTIRYRPSLTPRDPPSLRLDPIVAAVHGEGPLAVAVDPAAALGRPSLAVQGGRGVAALPAGAGRPALIALALTTLVAAGCSSLKPEPLTLDAIEARASRDRQSMSAAQETLPPVLTVEQVAARAIKYNLEHRQRLLETAVQQGALDVSRLDLLPRLTASAGYLVRSNDLYAQQQQLGQPYNQDTPFTTSSERRHRIAGAEFGWNLLDFGVSYYRARVQADQVMIADERKRKVVQNILQDVRSVYWRALGAQRLAPRVDDLILRADAALASAREVETSGLMPVPQALAYQRALLDSITLLQSRRHEMELARAELAALMNAAGQTFQLSDLAEEPLPPAPLAISELEDLAMLSRPELREEDYRKRISANEARRALASTWPGLSLDLGWQYDSNRYLLHNAWAEGGLRVSLNLLRLAAIPSIQRQAESQAQLDDMRRMAQSMAILTQVRVAALGYGLARSEFSTYSRSAEVDERMVNYSRASASSRIESDLEVIRTEARSMLSEYQRYIAYANAQAAIGRLYNSIGFDLDAEDDAVPVRELATQIRQSVRKWEWITFGQPVSMAQAGLPLVALRLEGVDDPGERARIARTFAEVYRRHDLKLVVEGEVGTATPAWILVAARPQPVATVMLPVGALPSMASMPEGSIVAGATRRDAGPLVAAPVLAVTAGSASPGEGGRSASTGPGGAGLAQTTGPDRTGPVQANGEVEAGPVQAKGRVGAGPIPANGRDWALMAVRPNGSIATLGSYAPLALGDDIAFRREGDIRGAAEASAAVMREFVIGSPLRSAE